MLITALDRKLRQRLYSQIFTKTKTFITYIIFRKLLDSLFTIILCSNRIEVAFDSNNILDTFIPKIIFSRKSRYHRMAITRETRLIHLQYSFCKFIRWVLRFIAIKTAPCQCMIFVKRIIDIPRQHNSIVFAFNMSGTARRKFAIGHLAIAEIFFIPTKEIHMARIDNAVLAVIKIEG